MHVMNIHTNLSFPKMHRSSVVVELLSVICMFVKSIHINSFMVRGDPRHALVIPPQLLRFNHSKLNRQAPMIATRLL